MTTSQTPAFPELPAERARRVEEAKRLALDYRADPSQHAMLAVMCAIDALAALPAPTPASVQPAYLFAKDWLNARKRVGDAFEQGSEHLGLDDVADMLRDFAAGRAALGVIDPTPAEIVRQLQDPVAVHVAMLRGEIAKPAIRDMLHAYGDEALAQYDRGAAPQAAAAEGAPKDIRSMLDAVVDIYFDGVNHAPEHRCYVDGSLDAIMDEAKKLLAATLMANGPAETRRDRMVDAVEAAISSGPMDPIHAFDRHSWAEAWHMEPPPEPREDHLVLQGRRSCAIRAVDAVLALAASYVCLRCVKCGTSGLIERREGLYNCLNPKCGYIVSPEAA